MRTRETKMSNESQEFPVMFWPQIENWWRVATVANPRCFSTQMYWSRRDLETWLGLMLMFKMTSWHLKKKVEYKITNQLIEQRICIFKATEEGFGYLRHKCWVSNTKQLLWKWQMDEVEGCRYVAYITSVEYVMQRNCFGSDQWMKSKVPDTLPTLQI